MIKKEKGLVIMASPRQVNISLGDVNLPWLTRTIHVVTHSICAPTLSLDQSVKPYFFKVLTKSFGKS